ncbi:hypothetical protein [Martelella endophytica]|uniref:Uncharacterized protein n=1 Tax=Martelella endophytica TaxID=1486262 RepID=A0A0D5LPE7_MAREN|nr:hypothetical protein [Martelella endophytica]AJY45820.1 hypothetical protein TM49_09180 [Martelella endophytica]
MKKQMIEFGGQPVGIVVPENGRLKFVAVKFHVHALDGELYDTMDELRNAIRAQVAAFYEGGGERAAAAG